MARSKYKLRPDGRRETTKTYKVGTPPRTLRKHFYGRSDAEIDNKIAEYEKSLSAPEIGLKRRFEKVADEWWEHKREEISPNTVSGYTTAKNRAIDEFGEIPVDQIKPQAIIEFLRRFQKERRSQKVINNTKLVLKGIFDDAVIAGDIPSNPCVGLPHIKGKPKEARQPATDDDIRIISECRTESMMSRLYYFLLYTGMRRCEAVALKGKDFDLKQKTVRVSRSIAYDGPEPIEKIPKTAAGIRTVDLLDNVIEILPKMSKEKYVFFPDGIPKEKALEVMLKKFQTEHGLSCTPHQLRHSYASMLHSAGIDVKDAQYLLGHANIAVTQDIYTHIEETRKKKVRAQLNDYVGKTINK